MSVTVIGPLVDAHSLRHDAGKIPAQPSELNYRSSRINLHAISHAFQSAKNNLTKGITRSRTAVANYLWEERNAALPLVVTVAAASYGAAAWTAFGAVTLGEAAYVQATVLFSAMGTAPLLIYGYATRRQVGFAISAIRLNASLAARVAFNRRREYLPNMKPTLQIAQAQPSDFSLGHKQQLCNNPPLRSHDLKALKATSDRRRRPTRAMPIWRPALAHAVYR